MEQYHRTKQQLDKVEEILHPHINASYAAMAADQTPINNSRPEIHKPISSEDQALIDLATSRVGHLTGSIAIKEARAQGEQ